MPVSQDVQHDYQRFGPISEKEGWAKSLSMISKKEGRNHSGPGQIDRTRTVIDDIRAGARS